MNKLKILLILLICAIIISGISIYIISLFSNNYEKDLDDPKTWKTPFNNPSLLDKNSDVEIIKNNPTKKSDICIMMVGTKNILDYYNKTITKNKEYANKQGYDFVAYIGNFLNKNKYAPHFNRYYTTYLLFEQGYKYVLYIDCDAVVNKDNMRIEEFIDMMNPEHYLLLSEDYKLFIPGWFRKMRINSGVLLLKNCDKCYEFLNIILKNPNFYHRYQNIYSDPSAGYDQCIIEFNYKFIKPHVKIISMGLLHGLLQGYPYKNKKSFIKHYVYFFKKYLK